mmetsp:Transcript_105733/g.328409  ORF Transcript_105733/g.328409 Transcript_105733/m.328409 type:complete len:413 (-) Transcript_105733:28-1266(-)
MQGLAALIVPEGLGEGLGPPAPPSLDDHRRLQRVRGALRTRHIRNAGYGQAAEVRYELAKVPLLGLEPLAEGAVLGRRLHDLVLGQLYPQLGQGRAGLCRLPHLAREAVAGRRECSASSLGQRPLARLVLEAGARLVRPGSHELQEVGLGPLAVRLLRLELVWLGLGPGRLRGQDVDLPHAHVLLLALARRSLSGPRRLGCCGSFLARRDRVRPGLRRSCGGRRGCGPGCLLELLPDVSLLAGRGAESARKEVHGAVWPRPDLGLARLLRRLHDAGLDYVLMQPLHAQPALERGVEPRGRATSRCLLSRLIVPLREELPKLQVSLRRPVLLLAVLLGHARQRGTLALSRRRRSRPHRAAPRPREVAGPLLLRHLCAPSLGQEVVPSLPPVHGWLGRAELRPAAKAVLHAAAR